MTESDMEPTSNGGGRKPTGASLRGLDGLNFFLADVRDGMGPFLGTFLREAHRWDTGRVGVVRAASRGGTVLRQARAGASTDRPRAKRLAPVLATAAIATSFLVIYLFPVLPVVMAAQGAIGAAATIFPPAVAALTLGLV